MVPIVPGLHRQLVIAVAPSEAVLVPLGQAVHDASVDWPMFVPYVPIGHAAVGMDNRRFSLPGPMLSANPAQGVGTLVQVRRTYERTTSRRKLRSSMFQQDTLCGHRGLPHHTIPCKETNA